MKQKTKSRIPRGPKPETERKTERITEQETDRRTLRERLLATRRALPEALRRQADESIAQRLGSLLESTRGLLRGSTHESPRGATADGKTGRSGAVLIGLYWPIDAEPGIDPILAWLHSRAVRFALPVVVARSSPLRFVAWQPGDPMTTGAYGIPRPIGDLALDPDVLIVPCVGFDARCFRIGYGGGYYDRTLAGTGRTGGIRPVAIGLAYDELEVADAAPQAHDVALDAVVTPTRLLTNPRLPSRSPETDPPG